MKKLGIFLIALIVLLGVGAGVFIWNINTVIQALKPQIVKEISTASNLPISAGEIGVSFFPSIAVELQNIGLADEFGHLKQGAKVERLFFETSLSSLINGSLAIKALILRNASVNVMRNAEGNILIDGVDVTRRAHSDKSTVGTTTELDKNNPLDTGDNKSKISFSIEEITLRDLSVNWTDISTQPTTSMQIANLDGEVSINVADKVAKIIASLNGKDSTIVLDDIFTKSTGEVFSINTNLEYVSPENIKADTLTINLGNSSLKVPFEFSDGKKEITIETTELNLGELASFIPEVSKFRLSGALDIALRILIEKNKRTPLLFGSISSKKTGLFLPVSEQPSGSEAALPLTNMNGLLKFDGDQVDLNDFSLSLAGQPLHISGKAKGLPTGNLAIRLQSDKLIVDEILTAIGKPPLSGTQSQLQDLDLVVTYSLSSKTGDINLKIPSGSIAGIDVNSVYALASLTPKDLQLSETKLQTFGGSLQLSGSLAQDERKQFAANLNANNMRAENIFAALKPGGGISLSGLISSASTKLAGSLFVIPQSLSGPAELEIQDGEIVGVNVLRSTLGKITDIPGLKGALISTVPERFQSILATESTAFKTLSLKTTIKDNRIEIANASLIHPIYTIEGNGWVDFNGNVNLQTQLKLQQELTQSMLEKSSLLKNLLDKFNQLSIPVLIKRKDGKILVLPDTSVLLKNAVTGRAKEAADKVLDKVSPELGGAKKILDSLF